MKQNVRRVLAVSGMAIVIGASSFGYEASANISNNGRHKQRTELRGKGQENRFWTKKRTIPGHITSINGTTITIARKNKTFTVNTDSNTKFLDRGWGLLALADLKVGDKVRVKGSILNTTITAQTVRDISIPLHSEKSPA